MAHGHFSVIPAKARMTELSQDSGWVKPDPDDCEEPARPYFFLRAAKRNASAMAPPPTEGAAGGL
jgi:hypothetical protein